MTQRVTHRILAGLVTAALVVTVAACAEDSPGNTSPAGPPPMTSVTYLTSFGTFGRDAYAYVAVDKGYFADAGLDVTIRPGTGTVDIMKLIASGQADYGVGDLAGVITTLANGSMPVKAVSAIHQKSLIAIASLDKKIDSPEKLVGTKVADSPASTVVVIFPAYAKEAGIDPKSVTFVPSNPQALPQLLAAGSVDAIGQFVVGQPLLEKAAGGKTVTMLPYADKLPDLYGIGLLASTSKISNDRAQVEKFNAALLKGLQYAVDHPDEAAQILKKAVPTTDAQVAAAELTAMRPYVVVDGTSVGQLDKARIQRMIDLFAGTGTLQSTPKADDVAVFDLVH